MVAAPPPDAPPRRSDCLTRAEDALARRMRLAPPENPVSGHFQTSLVLIALVGSVAAMAQALVVASLESRPQLAVFRVGSNAFLAATGLVAAFGPLRRGRVSQAAAWWGAGVTLYLAVMACTIGLRNQPQLVALAVAPGMVIGMVGRWRTLVTWAAAMVVVLAVGFLGPWQDPSATYPPAQLSASILVFSCIGAVLIRHRQRVRDDVTEHRARARELAVANARLRETNARLEAVIAERDQLASERDAAQRLEATGRMAGAVAHDFNNILAVLRGHVDLLDSAPAADVAEMQRTIARGAGLTAQLLAFARRQPSRPEPLDLAALVHTMAPMLERLAGTPVRLVVDAPAPVGVHADRTQLEQVLVNLVVNARDALPAGGRVTIRVGTETGAEGAPLAVLEVEDDGVGMDAETHAHMFEPFFTTRAAQGGTGLGLSTVYGIVHRHDGRIDVRSAPGAGTSFRVRLPRIAELPAAAPVEPPPPATVDGARLALLVEDEAAVRQVLERMLQKAGCTVIVVPDGTQALLELAPRPVRFDLLVTDVRMPGASGAEVAAAYLRARPDGKVVLISGDLDPALVDGLRGAGDVTFLAKPFSRDALVAAIAPAPSRHASGES